MKKNLITIIFLASACLLYAQETESASKEDEMNVVRPDNAVVLSIGSAVANGDLPEAKFDLNMQIGYKRAISPKLNIGLTYNKYNIVFGDIYNEGFMSFDLDLEYLFFPEKQFTPYVYAGPGLNAANGLKNTSGKFQFGIGLELFVSNSLSLKLYADRNFLSTDNVLDGLEAGAGNDAFYKIGFGTNIYFPRNTKKLKKGERSFIEKNKLEDF